MEQSIGAQWSGVVISNEQFMQLMTAIELLHARFKMQLSNFKAEVRQEQEEAATKALKRARSKKPYSYRRKGNKEQALFNESANGAPRGRDFTIA